jgi:hypothetical protein
MLFERISAVLERTEAITCLDGARRALISWNGNRYPCTPNNLFSGRDLVPGGFELDTPLTLFVRKNAFANPLTADNTTVTVDSEEHSADEAASGARFDAATTADNLVTVDSTATTIDTHRKPPAAGQKLLYAAPPVAGAAYKFVSYRIAQRLEVGSHYKFVLQEPNNSSK